MKFDKCNNNNLSVNQSNANFTILVLFTFGKKKLTVQIYCLSAKPPWFLIITITKIQFQVLSPALIHTSSLGVYVRQNDALG